MVLTLLLAACAGGSATMTAEPGPPRLAREQAVDLAWEALEPNTASHDRANWTAAEVRQVQGRSVAKEFEDWAFMGACGGPAPPLNSPIEVSETYFYVVMVPQLATPSGPPLIPKGPPAVPEASIAQATFLIDEYGQVIARMFRCVLY